MIAIKTIKSFMNKGYAGTSGNRLSLKNALAYEKNRAIKGESYQVEINGKIEGVFEA